MPTTAASADAEGIGSLTMRRPAHELGVEAMSLYHHVANKDDVLDGITDLVLGEIEVPVTGTPWKSAIRHRTIQRTGSHWRTPGPRCSSCPGST
jgi:AcrR family transcriptional regulator